MIYGRIIYRLGMDTRWLKVLVDLHDLGTLRAVSESSGYSTSAVSQQLASLQKEVDCSLVEPVGRRLELTPDGLALLRHARTVLESLESARSELGDSGELTGKLRVAGYATSIQRHVIPAASRLQDEHPDLQIHIQESEPEEVRRQLAKDEIDVGVVYDHSLVPHPDLPSPFWLSPMLLAVGSEEKRSGPEVVRDQETVWIANSRGSDDDRLIEHLTATVGLLPRIDHHIDSISLVVNLVAAGMGVALIAADTAQYPGVEYLALEELAGTRRSYITTRPGREKWGPVRALTSQITQRLPD